MKSTYGILLLFLSVSCASVRDAARPFSEENVTRILGTLSADSMMGRSALRPEIAMATTFIEEEFSVIGLVPMKGLGGFRQEFTKERVRPQQVDAIVNGGHVLEEDVLVFSDKKEINISGGLRLIECG